MNARMPSVPAPSLGAAIYEDGRVHKYQFFGPQKAGAGRWVLCGLSLRAVRELSGDDETLSLCDACFEAGRKYLERIDEEEKRRMP